MTPKPAAAAQGRLGDRIQGAVAARADDDPAAGGRGGDGAFGRSGDRGPARDLEDLVAPAGRGQHSLDGRARLVGIAVTGAGVEDDEERCRLATHGIGVGGGAGRHAPILAEMRQLAAPRLLP
jgi:hypothetical protein